MSTPAAITAAKRRGPWRWFVALVATVLLVVSGSGLVVFAASGEAGSKGPGWVSADAPVYVEARPDMPGGQADAVAQMMTAFPGFADAGAFDLKATELVDGLMASATSGVLTYSGELEQVITGEMGLALLDLESAMMGDDPSIVIGIAHNDAAAAQALVDRIVASAGDEDGLTRETYGAATVISDSTAAVAVHDEWLLLSPEVEQVKAAIDALEGNVPSLKDDPEYQVAMERLPRARLASAYINLRSLGSVLELASLVAAGQTGMDLPAQELIAQLPVDMAASLSAEPDRLHLHAFITPGEGTPTMNIGESDLAELFPADTQIYLETRDLGATVEDALGQLTDLMAAQAESGAVDDGTLADLELLFSEESPITSMLGAPLPEFFGVLGDTAVGGGLSSDGIALGIASVVEDEDLAAARVERMMSILRLAAAGEETGITIADVSVADVPAVSVTLPVDSMGAGGLPIQVDDTITVAVDDGHLLVGLGDFVETALTQDAADSLAASAGFQDALAGEVPNSGVMYANIGELLTAIDPLISMMAPEWEMVQPYATGLDRMVVVGSADDEVISARMSVIVDR